MKRFLETAAPSQQPETETPLPLASDSRTPDEPDPNEPSRGESSPRPEQGQNLRSLLSAVPVIPILTLPNALDAVPLAQALVAGGLHILEVTLRTGAALDSIHRMATEVPECVVGAGTITRPADLIAAARAGAEFAVSPGLTPELRRHGANSPIPLLPGVATPSEAMTAFDAGFDTLKLFPAEASGGQALLKSMAGPLPDLRFCPTGGIHLANFRQYLSLPNVLCVGGSWVAPSDAIAAGDFDRIRELARHAVQTAAEP